MEQSDWKNANQNKFLTIKRARELFSENNEIKVLSFHRNIWDETTQNNEEHILHDPTHFFSKSYCIIRKIESKTFPDGENKEENKEEKNLNNLSISFEWDINFNLDFEFDLYLEECECWYPLKNGYIPTHDEQEIFQFNFSEPKHYSTFDENTKVGWRGPMMLWSEIDDNQKIYYRYPD